MRKILNRATSFAKKSVFLDGTLRYNPFYYSQIKQLLEKVSAMDISARRDLTNSLLDRALGWARSIHHDSKDGVSISRWSILEKEELRGKEESFRNSRIFAIPAATSGTTGVPIKLWRSLRSIAAEQAFLDQMLDHKGLTFRSARIAKLCGDNIKLPSDRIPPFGELTQAGKRLILSSQHLSSASIDWYADELNKFKPDILWIYPSSGEALVRCLQERNLNIRIPLVLSSSEVLHTTGRKAIEKTLEATVIDYYGLAERTVFAVSYQPNEFFFNPAYGRVEFRPVDEDRVNNLATAEIISTGYWNEAMPLIRYRTGDRIFYPATFTDRELDEVSLGVRPVVAIGGRDNNYLVSARGEVLVGIDHLPRETSNIIRMQIIQESFHYIKIKVVPDKEFSQRDRQNLLSNVKKKIPEEIQVEVELVSQLDRLPSGKIPFVVRKGTIASNQH